MDAPPALESHGKLVPVSARAQHRFHLVFSNKTESDAYCLVVWRKLTARGVQVRSLRPHSFVDWREVVRS